MPMKTIGVREKSVEIVQATIAEFRDVMVEGLHKILAPGLRPGETMPDIDFLLTLVDRAFDRLLAALKEAERTVLDLRSEERFLRRKRRELGKVLYAKIVKVREQLKTLFGRVAAAALSGIHGNTPQGWRELMFLAQHLEERLSAPGLELPKPVTPIEEPNPAKWIAQFHDETVELAKLKKQVRKAARKAESAVRRKDRELEIFNTTFVGLVEVLAAVLRLVGFEEPARTVQPSKQDRGVLLRRSVSRRKASRTRKASKAAAEAKPEAEAEPEAASRPSSRRSGET